VRYSVEIKWNREFHFVWRSSHETLDEARSRAHSPLNMGDGACVKATRILDENTGKYVR